MERDRRHWRIRLSTLMLLVIIAGLILALILEKQNSVRSEQRLRAEHNRAQLEAAIARTQMVYAQRAKKLAEQAARDSAAREADPGANAPQGNRKNPGRPMEVRRDGNGHAQQEAEEEEYD